MGGRIEYRSDIGFESKHISWLLEQTKLGKGTPSEIVGQAITKLMREEEAKKGKRDDI